MLAEKGGGPKKVCAHKNMKTARNSGPAVEKQSDLFEMHDLSMSAPRLQTLHKIHGYYGDQSKVFCTQDAQQTYGTGN